MFLKRLPNFTVKSALNRIVVSLRALGSNVKTVVNLIGSTTTEKGLSVICRIDENHYERGKKITEEQKENLNIEFTGPNEKWNYIIRPNV